MALHIPHQDPANQHPPPPGEEETQQTHFPACEIICNVDVKQLIQLLIVLTVSSVSFILFFLIFFPLHLWCLAFPRGTSLVWPTQCWQQQLREFQRLVVSWEWEIQQQHCPTLSWVGLAALGTALPWHHGACNKGLVLLPFGL